MELAKYKACLCEGSAEEAVIDILVDNDLLIFTREEMLEERVVRCRNAKRFEERFLRKEHMINLSVPGRSRVSSVNQIFICMM